MIAVDTNILVYAHRPEMPFHDRAREVLDEALKKPEPLAVPWPCLHEFLAIVTHPRIFHDPTPTEIALDALGRLRQSLHGGLLGEGDGYFEALDSLARPARLQGPIIHDARLAAICHYHGVRELWSADRDFSRFAAVRVRNPLL
ncbi:MAG: TA system VapC family ribonuclease toxin [Halioglobus sp.]|nr:TA system VapC family ribonuclease toxin [Halioglobus sp.]